MQTIQVLLIATSPLIHPPHLEATQKNERCRNLEASSLLLSTLKVWAIEAGKAEAFKKQIEAERFAIPIGTVLQK